MSELVDRRFQASKKAVGLAEQALAEWTESLDDMGVHGEMRELALEYPREVVKAQKDLAMRWAEIKAEMMRHSEGERQPDSLCARLEALDGEAS